MKQSYWLEANSRSACHKISLLSMWNPNESLLHWRKHKDISLATSIQSITSHPVPVNNNLTRDLKII